MKLPPLYFVLPFLLQATLWRIVMRPFFYLCTGFEVRGLENLKGLPSGVIFAPNHSSELDSVLLPLALPLWSKFSPMFYIVREPKFYTDPVFSWRRHVYDLVPFNALGAYSIVSGVKDYSVSLKKHVDILADGGSVCIFPEGGFTKTGEIQRAHGGVSYLAHARGRKIVPVLIEGTFRLRPMDVLRGRARITITFLPAIDPKVSLPEHPTIDEYRTLAERVLNALREERARQAIEKELVYGSDSVPVLHKPSQR